MSLREVVAGPPETDDNPAAEERRGFGASLQRIIAGTIAISAVLVILGGVGYGVMRLLDGLNGVGGGTQTQDLFAVGIWGVLLLLEGRPRLAKPGKRSKKKNSVILSGFVVLNPALSALLTLAGLATASDPMAVPTLAVAGLSFAVIGWRGYQGVQALKERNAAFSTSATPEVVETPNVPVGTPAVAPVAAPVVAAPVAPVTATAPVPSEVAGATPAKKRRFRRAAK